MSKKLKIKNRKNQNIVVMLDFVKNPVGLVFVMHGLGGFKEQPHIQAFADVFLAKNYNVVRFDTTNTLGESDGNYEDATVTNYYQDLEDVIKWASSQDWYQEPFCLVGHSLGGISTALFAQNYPEKVKALAPVSTVVYGKISLEKHSARELDNWKKTGFKITKSVSKPGVIKKLKWSHIEDRLKYDLLPKAKKLTMPVLLMVGEKDERTPIAHQQILFDALPQGKKEIHTIPGAAHTFRDSNHLKQIKEILNSWINKI